MDVTFTKVDGKRYSVAIERERGPALVTRAGPGYDDLMPHDVAHFVVEEHFEIRLGVWGQLAAGGTGIFRPAPEDDTLRHRRRGERIAGLGRSDMARSEDLVVLVVGAWERSIGRVKHQVRHVGIVVDDDEMARAIERMDAVAHRWRALRPGGALLMTWPARLTFRDSGAAAGRRTSTSRRRRTPLVHRGGWSQPG